MSVDDDAIATNDGSQTQASSQLRAARRSTSDAARPDIVSRLGSAGRLTAHERLRRLIDPGSEVEYGRIAALDPRAASDAPSGAFVAETGGIDLLARIAGQVAVVSSTDYSDRGGGYGAARLGRLFGLAREHRYPVVLFVDGGGSRAQHPRAQRGHIELSGAIGPFTVFDGMAELSGWVPTIAIVAGPSFAGHASIAGFSDVVIATADSAIGMGGPPMVEAALGKRLSPTELASARMQADTGGIELLVADEAAAIAAARRVLGYVAPVGPGEPVTPPEGVLDDAASGELEAVLAATLDGSSWLELRGKLRCAVRVGLARLGGRACGVIASERGVDEGRIDERAAQKIHRHVELCDAWGLPLLVLIDSAGVHSAQRNRDGSEQHTATLSRGLLRPLLAHQRRTTPLIALQLGLGRGIAPALLMGYSTGASVPFWVGAWAGAELDRADGYAQVHDANAIDDVITPAETRATLRRVFDLLPPGNRWPREPYAKARPVDSF